MAFCDVKTITGDVLKKTKMHYIFLHSPSVTLKRIQRLKDLISSSFFLLLLNKTPMGKKTLNTVTLHCLTPKLTIPQLFFLFGGFPARVKNKLNKRKKDKKEGTDRTALLLFIFQLLPQIDNNRFLKL